MTIVERLYEYMSVKGLTAYEVEKTCGISNGYLARQKQGSGNIGSEILVKILNKYPDINFWWLLFGKGNMLAGDNNNDLDGVSTDESNHDTNTQPHTQLHTHEEISMMSERVVVYEEMIKLLKEQITVLQAANADKDEIISLLKARLSHIKTPGKR